ncbi:MAG: hypothetical protein WC788_07740 [Candidatus Paceibacterota bacterium]|jgi:hypothetical protein
MTNNVFSGSSIRPDQVEKGLRAAKEEGNIHIDYSKIKFFSQAFEKAAAGKKQIAKYELDDVLDESRKTCNISSIDFEEIKEVLMGGSNGG